MSRLLSELLGAGEPGFSQTIREMELATNSSGIDISLSTDIKLKIEQKLRELGLDQNDTNGPELYHSLQHLVSKHDSFIASVLGINDDSGSVEVLAKVKAKIETLKIPKTVWALKHSVAKKLLKQNPPKHLMKQLGYRSVDSMLKREHVSELFGALRFAESEQWLERFIRNYKKLKSQDFESRLVEILLLTDERYQRLARDFINSRGSNITHLKEMGLVVMLPMPPNQLRGLSLMMFVLTLHNIDEVRAYSALFKLEQVRPDFASNLVKTLLLDSGNHANLFGQPIHWKLIRRHFGSVKYDSFPEVFEPNLQLDDLLWQHAEDTLYHIEPALKFWHEVEYVGLPTIEGAVSFNLIDNIINYCNHFEFDRRINHHFSSELWNQLLLRYMGHKKVEQHLLQQLDNSFADEESIII